MKLYIYKTVKCEVINVEFLNKDLQCALGYHPPPPSKTPPPLICQAPPLNFQTVQAPPPF